MLLLEGVQISVRCEWSFKLQHPQWRREMSTQKEATLLLSGFIFLLSNNIHTYSDNALGFNILWILIKPGLFWYLLNLREIEENRKVRNSGIKVLSAFYAIILLSLLVKHNGFILMWIFLWSSWIKFLLNNRITLDILKPL